ncbi:hypothetical protein C4568_01600 [Candidatus Parcubacteria bacterium]|nr:MAG: hypothetical protein C4568_01600 [Candidatus Parcubacteria bacterium]
MGSDFAAALESWLRELPSSQMVYPRQLHHRIKYLFWRVYTPYHPFLRDTALALGIVKHEGRQNFLLGHITPEAIPEFIARCVERGYGNHFVAWNDDGQLASLRIVEDFERQYHLRIFEDGEVRGHYEYTPECYPILHLREIGLEDRRHIFNEHIGDLITPVADSGT